MEMDYPKTRMDNFFAKAAGSELADDSMEPITDREYWINEMAKKTAGGGLPTIEEGDDGKVLTVSSGKAVWARGGGGDSDFSIANVTFVNTYSGVVSLGGPVVFEENEMGEGAPALAYDLFNSIITPNETVTRKIPLYKGSALITFGDTFTCATTGDIEAVGPGMLLVTGGGTITITYVGD